MRPPSNLEILGVVVHDVPRPGDPEPLILTEAAVDLDADLENYFRDKVLESLEARGLGVAADPDQDDTVRTGVQRILDDAEDHVSASRAMAEHLYELQKRTNSPGLLTVVRAHADDEPCVAVLKLEREVGVHVQVELQAGRQVIDLEYLRDLTLTRKTRVFKAAVLFLADADDPLTMRGVASDDQRSRLESRGIARFFLYDFLGCQLSESPEKATQDFWTGTQVFINEDVRAPERQGRYQVAVQAYLEEPDEDLRPQTFIQRSIDPNDRPRLRQRLRDEGLDPQITVGKDTALIQRKIDGFRLTFEHGMTLVGRRDDLVERVRLPDESDPGAPTQVDDAVKRLSGR